MTKASWPVLNMTMDDAQWARLGALFASSGVVGSVGGPELKAYRTASGLFVPPGSALVRGVFFDLSGADEQITVPQNAGGSNRLDLLTLRINLASSPNPDFAYLVGGSTAPAPTRSPTGIFDVPIGVCTVPSGSAVPSKVDDARDHLGLDLLPCRKVDDIPAELRRIGRAAFETTTGKLRFWNGTEWRSVSVEGHTHPYMPASTEPRWFRSRRTADRSLGTDSVNDVTIFARTTSDITPSDMVSVSVSWSRFQCTATNGNTVGIYVKRGSADGPTIGYQQIKLDYTGASLTLAHGGGSMEFLDDEPGTNPTYYLVMRKHFAQATVSLIGGPGVPFSAEMLVKRRRL